MGLFGKLFEKKECSVCSGEIGLLGNRKLEDGNLCKNCAKKLSYWFDDRRHSTVEEIKAQLAYREENQKKVAAFNVTRSFGRGTTVVLDEDKQQFMVVRTNDMYEENPDVLDFSQVVGCDLDVSETRNEDKMRLEDGTYESYSPPRYTWFYDFNFIINVNHPYFDDMHFRLNDASVRIESRDIALSRGLFGGSYAPTAHPDYKEYEQMAIELRTALTQMRQHTRTRIEEANKPKTAVICPCCRATTMPDANGCCEYCGSPVAGN